MLVMQKDLISFSPPNCKRCASHSVVKDGWYQKKLWLHRYRCKRCGYRFVKGDLPKRRFTAGVIAFAVKLYAELGISLRATARKVKELFGKAVSHTTIQRWVLHCAELPLPTVEPVYGPVWHADETMVRGPGEWWWLWVVEDRETRGLLALHLSRERSTEHAMTVLRKAKEAAGMRPQEVVTDGLYDYRSAIKKVLGYRYVKHTVDSGVGKNAVLERLNREIKRRTKWFTAFRSFESCEHFFRVWQYYYNQRHNSSTGISPCQQSLRPFTPLTHMLRGQPP